VPGDNDRPPHGGEDQLVAEIIPLRRRAPLQRDTERLPVEEQFVGEQATAAGALTGERSVWEPPPSGQLRRRTPPKRPRATAAQQALGRRGYRRLLAVATLVPFATFVALLVVLAPTHPAPRRTSELRGNVALTSQGELAQQHSTAGSEDSRDRGPHARRHSTSSMRATKQVRRPGGSDLAESTSSGSPSKAESTVGAEVGAGTHSQASTVSSQSAVAQPAASSAAASNSTAQDECVPGELGC
jgi:hypothetical protein